MISRMAILITMALAIAALITAKPPETTPRFVWNLSASVPTGLYMVSPPHDLTVASLVIAYPPEPLATWLADGHYLPHGLPLLKPVIAITGQTVCRLGPVITVDGRKIGVALEQDHNGRSLPVWEGCHVIDASEIFLMNPAEPTSLDGRYFGPIPMNTIAGRAIPLWTSKEG